ncbi:TetR/AcrR family transcriptional regulator [Nocardioides cynanchi]|uniref:TetR/AcrR family transcriptional regulator n=1 Tax=Nocardioides cynanchi TaxID=2558918 RepID=UPI001EE1CC1F|nr:TetR/AcrR family transcriptional regulator [Nocardioides cynanchi]
MTTRRDELAEGATDYALEHGLVGLSLRPLAESLGTSDRMLLYHFRDKDDLITTILRTSNARSMQGIRDLPPSVDLRTAVLDLWRTVSRGDQQRCQRLYVEAAALGLFGREPYATEVREANAAWMSALAGHLVAAGLARADARRVAELVDSAFVGLQMDQPLDSAARQRRTVADLADAVADRWVPS